MIDQQEKAQNSPTCRSPEEKADNPLWSDGESIPNTACVQNKCTNYKMIITHSSVDVHDTSDPVRSPKSMQPVENDMNSKAEEEEAPQQDEVSAFLALFLQKTLTLNYKQDFSTLY